MSVQYNHPSFKATENIPHTPGSSLSPFLPPNGSAVKTSPCVATHPGRPAIRRPHPNLHPQAARLLRIRLMYAPPFRHISHAPIRPLVVHVSLSFPNASFYLLLLWRLTLILSESSSVPADWPGGFLQQLKGLVKHKNLHFASFNSRCIFCTLPSATVNYSA